MNASTTAHRKKLPAMAEKCPVQELQEKWYPEWEANNYFFTGKKCTGAAAASNTAAQSQATAGSEKHSSPDAPPFVVMLPPPNVTGTLHIGHALTVTLQDMLVRWQGMQGRDVLWVPGCDHAGIATQVVLEQHLLATKGVTRHTIGREQFVREAWQWKDAKEARIYQQLRKLGAALDWNRAVFTMDQGMSDAVVTAFIKLYNKGLIYRRPRLVNYCPALQSVLSDIEVDHHKLDGPTALTVPGHDGPVTFGKIYDVAYPVLRDGDPTQDTGQKIIVSTTRPETIPADAAVMVHPSDERYKSLVGRRVANPCRAGQSLPVVADTAVAAGLGTGAVKVTPGMSAVDYEVGLRHNLPAPYIFASDGTFDDTLPHLQGMGRFRGREVLLQQLKERGLLCGERPHAMTLPRCSRTGDVIETRLQTQWFVSVKEMAERALAAVETGALTIEPASQRNVWTDWLNNTKQQDWCISRQIWWGHRVPMYRASRLSATTADDDQTKDEDHSKEIWVAAASEEEARMKAAQQLGAAASMVCVQQDADVLDTWFSSALFPFAALGWPTQTPELSRYYPTSVLVTGQDILFYWVARMVWLGTELTGQLPFKRVLLHGLVCDSAGNKMSKSRGNVIDPMQLIAGATHPGTSSEEKQPRLTALQKQRPTGAVQRNSEPRPSPASEASSLPVVGADVLRIALLSLNLSSDYVQFGASTLESYRTLPNKMWQTIRFLRQACDKIEVEELPALQHLPAVLELPVMERWLLHSCHALVAAADQHLHSCNTAALVTAFTTFWWTRLCDTYLEAIKPVITSAGARVESSCAAERRAAVAAAAQALGVLCGCCLAALQVVAPVMPHLADELYHCLPHVRGTQPKDSIMATSYPVPQQVCQYEDAAVEAEVSSWLEVAAALRTLIASCRISSTTLTGSVYTSSPDLISPTSSAELRVVASHLARLKDVELVNVAALDGETGCAQQPRELTLSTPLGSSTIVHLNVQGLIDVDKELERLQKKQNKLLKQSNTKKFHKGRLDTIERLNSEMQQIERIMESIRQLQ